MGLSAATLRNTMADLEDLGYLTQPHTSAGRIPTEKGYRVYVDSMMRAAELSYAEKEYIREKYASANHDFEEVMAQTSKILSEISHYIGVALSPQLHESVLQRLELISIDAEHILAVLVMTSGVVENKLLSAPSGLSDKAVYRIKQILNEKLTGLSLKEIRGISQDPIKMKTVFDCSPSAPMAVVARDTFALDRGIHVYIDGTSNFFSHPEFGEVQKIEPLFRTLERKEQIADLLLSQQSDAGLQILIGSENRCEGMKMCSVVRSRYRVRGEQYGTIAVIGPTRMAYSRVVSIVRYTAQIVSQFLEASR
jgi:heat-inducible transcriptional repressor